MKQREQILLEPEQKKRLQEEADRTGVPKTEIMRRALDAWLDDDEWDRQMRRDAKS
jgi:predicted DNA-binding protein